jgi:hypothetical protein
LLFRSTLKASRKTEWVVYCKPPFGGAAQVLDYLGRYTHRTAISNHRLVRLEAGKVTFRWRDYKDGNKQKLMTLDAEEFIRRFLLHVLPRGFVRIRHFGFLANAHRERKLTLCRKLLGVQENQDSGSLPAEDWKTRYERLTGESLSVCPACHQGRLFTVETIPALRQGYSLPAGFDSS